MSHVAQIDLVVKNLNILESAVKRLGGELIRELTNYRWFGRHVGDYPIPEGYTIEDMGKCDHVIRFPNASYDIGVSKKRDGKEGYDLLWDFFYSGGLQKVVGEKGEKLKVSYGIEATKYGIKAKGYRSETKTGVVEKSTGRVKTQIKVYLP